MRTIRQVATEILFDWGSKVSPHALPYLQAMLSLSDKNSMYLYDTAESVVLYGLSNMRTYRTPKAKALKAELKAILA